MGLTSAFVCFGMLLISVSSQAAPTAFQVHSVKQITENVDRFYNKNGTAFATIFCSDKAAEVMIVDGRFRDYDGKTFLFASPLVCQNARTQAKENAKKCTVNLMVDLNTMGATLNISKCR